MNIIFINTTEQVFVQKHPFFYKYLTFEESLNMFRTNTIRFSKPSLWKDPYEKFFYECYYQFPTVGCLTIPNKHRLMASCFTKESTCEAGWKMYGQESITVKIAFKTSDLFSAIKSTPGCDLYIGEVNYYSTNNIVKEVKNCLSSYSHSTMTQENWLNVLLFKRKAFDYEKEVRIFTFIDDNEVVQDGKYFLAVNNINMLCDNVTLSPNISQQMADALKPVYKAIGIKVKHSYLYKNINRNIITIP